MAKGRAELAIDTSCVIALVSAWHEHHKVTTSALERALDRGARLLVPAHVLVESFSVLTRLPAPHRISPADAEHVLRVSFQTARIAALPAPRTWSFLSDAAQRDVAGGRTYDAWIAATVRSAGAKRLVTWNADHFADWADGDLEVLTPSEL